MLQGYGAVGVGHCRRGVVVRDAPLALDNERLLAFMLVKQQVGITGDAICQHRCGGGKRNALVIGKCREALAAFAAGLGQQNGCLCLKGRGGCARYGFRRFCEASVAAHALCGHCELA